MPFRRRLSVATAALAALLLTSCATTSTPEETLPEVVVEVIDVPDSMRASHDAVLIGGDLLPAEGSHPLAFGGAHGAPGQGTQPTVWTSQDGRDWTMTQIEELDGSFDGNLVGNEHHTALGGTVWKDGVFTSRVWTSADREEWQPIELPDAFEERWITTIGVAGHRLVGAGVDVHGDGTAFVYEGGEFTVTDLPTDGEVLRPEVVVGNDENIVLIARPGDAGTYNAPVAYVSDDANDWSEAHPIDAEGSLIAGATWTGTEYVATGYAQQENAYVAAAWSSSDGSEWTRETLPALPDWWWAEDGSDHWLGAPSTADGIVAAAWGNELHASTGFVERSAEGEWRFVGTSNYLDGAGIGGLATPFDGGIVAITSGYGDTRTGILADGDTWEETSVVAERDNVAEIAEITPGQRVQLTLSQPSFSVANDGSWRESSVTTSAEFNSDSIDVVPFDPERAESLITVLRASDTTGTEEIVIGSDYLDETETILVEGFHRDSPDAEWQPMTGFRTDGATNLYGATKVGERWVAVGSYRTSSLVGTASQGVIWTSVNGVDWQTAEGEFGDGPFSTGIDAVCALPGGDALAIGWTEDGISNFIPAAWRSDGDAWERLDLGSVADKLGWFSTCADGDEGIVVAGYSDGRDTLWHTPDGDAWDRVYQASEGVLLQNPVAVDGGFAAAGSRTEGANASPVVWLSADGEDWVPVAVPSERLFETLRVAAVGDDLLVVLPAASGNPVVVVRDIAEVIASHTG